MTPFLFFNKIFLLHVLCRDVWTQTITIPMGVVSKYRYFKGFFLESKVSRVFFWYSSKTNYNLN